MENREYLSISDINRINTDLLAKSHISSTSGEIIETDEGMLDYIYLTYIFDFSRRNNKSK